MNILNRLIRHFDAWLSRVEHVEPFADEPLIILRLQDGVAAWDIPLGERTIHAGARVAVLHLWNDRMTVMTSHGPDLAWALQFQRRLLYSLQAAARHLRDTAGTESIEAVGGIIVHIHLQTANAGRLLLERLGFTVFPYHRPAGAFGEFWENLYTWLLIWAFNPASLRSHSLLGLQRNEFWMTGESFLARFGEEREPTILSPGTTHA